MIDCKAVRPNIMNTLCFDVVPSNHFVLLDACKRLNVGSFRDEAVSDIQGDTVGGEAILGHPLFES
jgi:hypothetical protein